MTDGKPTGDIGELLQFGRVDLFNLCPDEEAADPNELQPLHGHGGRHREESVYEVHGQVEGLAVELVHLAHLGRRIEEL